jgi:hypothetical protein
MRHESLARLKQKRAANAAARREELNRISNAAQENNAAVKPAAQTRPANGGKTLSQGSNQ